MEGLPVEIIDIIHSDDSKHNKLARILKFIVNSYGIDQADYYILGSYALREHRSISDLDVNMNSSAFDKLPRSGLGIIELYNYQIRWFLDMTSEYNKIDPDAKDFSIEIFNKCITDGFPNSDYSLGKLKENNSLDVDGYGHQFMCLQTLLQWKKIMGRPKDNADIILIESLLKNNTISGSHDDIIEIVWTPGHLMIALMIILILLLILFWDTLSDHICNKVRTMIC